MLAVVKAPRTRNTEPVFFRVEGDCIPAAVVEFLKREFPDSVEIENEDGYTRLEDWPWFKEITSKMTAGEAVKADRGLRGWTQKKTAAMLGISVQNLSEIERDVRPVSRKMAVKLGKVFGTPPESYFRFGG